MSMNSNQKYIETELIYSFLRILMDPSRLTNKLTAKLLEDYLNKFCKNKREESILESISNNSKQWSLDDLVKNFKLLNENKLAYSKIGYLKQKKFNEFKQKSQEFSFTPEINLTSKFLESQNTFKFLKNNPIENNKDNIHEKLDSEKFDNFSPEKSIEYRSLILSPEKIPVRIPINVIPICTVDKNLLGELANSNATFALLLPFFAAVSSLFFLAEISEISDMEKTPFNKIKMNTINSSAIILNLCKTNDKGIIFSNILILSFYFF